MASARLRGLAFSCGGKGSRGHHGCEQGGTGVGKVRAAWGPSDQPVPSRWRARQLVKNIPPSDMAQIKAKVAAMGVLQELRQDWGCRRAWVRDYLSSVSVGSMKAGHQGGAQGLRACRCPPQMSSHGPGCPSELWAMPLCPWPWPLKLRVSSQNQLAGALLSTFSSALCPSPFPMSLKYSHPHPPTCTPCPGSS